MLQTTKSASEIFRDYVTDGVPASGVHPPAKQDIRVWGGEIEAGIRERLTADRTYYVRTNGNDANTGLANTSGGAFLTLQKALDVAAALDLNGFNVAIQVGDGTYTDGGVVSSPWVGKGTVTLQGNAGTPGNVIVNPAGNAVTVDNGGRLAVKDMELRSTGAGCLLATRGGLIQFQNLRFGAASSGRHIAALSSSFIEATGNYAIVGSAQRHLVADGGDIDISGRTVTLTGTPAFSQYFAVGESARIQAVGCTFSGSATGVRYIALACGVIHTNGGGASYLPGNSAGSTPSGGQYT